MRNDLHVTETRNKKLSYLKKRLLIRTVFVFIDVKTERSTWSSIAQKVRASFIAYICMCQWCLLQKRRVWDGSMSKTSKRKRTFEFVESIGRKDQLNIHRLSSSSS